MDSPDADTSPPIAADTIAAVSTPPGRGGLGVVRVSGPQAASVAKAMLGVVPPPRVAGYRAILDHAGEVIDRGIALWFAGPASYTGEDVLEVQIHGAPVLLDLVVESAIQAGARAARPGEFTERAFLNGRLDLAQAEAVADLIAATTADAARAARRSLDGALSRRARALADDITALRVAVEAQIDFAEDEIDDAPRASPALAAAHGKLRRLTADVRRGIQACEGATVVILGRPNVGKSSLLNCLAGGDRAIVTAIPGTTRDLVEAHLDIEGVEVRLIDTAGLRESADPVEAEGVRRARAALDAADAVLMVTEAGAAPDPALDVDIPRVDVVNKIDLAALEAGWERTPAGVTARVSALSGAGMDALRAALATVVGAGEAAERAPFTARRRHLDALERVDAALAGAAETLDAPELLAEDLRGAQRALGEISGEVTSEDLLGRIFASFCIGK